MTEIDNKVASNIIRALLSTIQLPASYTSYTRHESTLNDKLGPSGTFPDTSNPVFDLQPNFTWDGFKLSRSPSSPKKAHIVLEWTI